MKLRSLRIQSFRGFKDQTTVKFGDGVNLIIGHNGAGKSSVLNAVEWCLFGRDVEKTASGLHGRMAWEVQHRDSKLATIVRLVFETEEGNLTITRTRPADAKRTTPDGFEIVLPNSDVLADDAAENWLADAGFPSWPEWRSSYCQHQEAARDRLIEKEPRMVSLAALLGLDEVASLRGILESVKLVTGKRTLKNARESINDELVELLEITSGLDEAAASIEQLGLRAAAVTKKSALEYAQTMLQEARELKRELGLDIEMPKSFSTIAEAVKWARAWRSAVRQDPGRLAELTELRGKKGVIEAILTTIEPLTKRVSEAERRLEEAISKQGERDNLEERVEAAQEKVREVNDLRKSNNQLHALLNDVVEIFDDNPTDICPVCESEISNLPEKAKKRLIGSETDVAKGLDRLLSDAQSVVQSEEEKLEIFESLEAQMVAATKSLKSAIAELVELFPTEESNDLLPAARKAQERLVRAVARLEKLESQRDAALDQHSMLGDRLSAMGTYLEALGKDSHRVDVKSLPGYQLYESAQESLAALISDTEALMLLAKDMQKTFSDERLAAVNKTLGNYFSMITGEQNAEARRMKVISRATAKRIDYQIVDSNESPLIPVLNQAALNAISMAMLFAQSEDASGGGPRLLVLDDPEQSLDSEHVNGLARAIETVAINCPVLVGATPGRLAERIEDFAACEKNVVTLGQWDPASGATIT